jgi:hypothetical protein
MLVENLRRISAVGIEFIFLTFGPQHAGFRANEQSSYVLDSNSNPCASLSILRAAHTIIGWLNGLFKGR